MTKGHDNQFSCLPPAPSPHISPPLSPLVTGEINDSHLHSSLLTSKIQMNNQSCHLNNVYILHHLQNSSNSTHNLLYYKHKRIQGYRGMAVCRQLRKCLQFHMLKQTTQTHLLDGVKQIDAQTWIWLRPQTAIEFQWMNAFGISTRSVC